MKKLFILVILACAAGGFVWSSPQKDDPDMKPSSKIYDLQYVKPAYVGYFLGKQVYYLQGFNFLGYKANHPTLEEISAAEVKAVREGIPGKVTKAGNNFSVIGLSQGGLRALGFISALEAANAADVNKIDAVITVSGIDQGLRALNGGLGAFKSRASEKIKIIGNGLNAAAGFVDVKNQWYWPLKSSAGSAFDLFLWFLPEQIKPYAVLAWASTDSKKVPQIAGMIPKSDYITNNVVSTVNYSYRKKTGELPAVEWRYERVSGINAGYVWKGNVNKYTYYSTVDATPQFDDKVPLGFIVGTDNNTLGMAKEAEIAARAALKGLEVSFRTAEMLHIAKSAGISGILTNSPSYAADAERAQRFCRNFDSELHDILGSPENDGLVARENQYIPRTFTNPVTGTTTQKLKNPVLGGEPSGYVAIPKNHAAIAETADTFAKAAEMIQEAEMIRVQQGLRASN